MHFSFSTAIAWLAQLDAASLDAQLALRLGRHPRCPVARYVAGCRCFDLGLPAHATRNFMIAHHAEPQFESAALLAFTGLAWISRRDVTLLDALIGTWEEYRRPAFDRSPREQRLLDGFRLDTRAETAGQGELSRFWRLPIRTVHHELRARAASNDDGGSDTISALRNGRQSGSGDTTARHATETE